MHRGFGLRGQQHFLRRYEKCIQHRPTVTLECGEIEDAIGMMKPSRAFCRIAIDVGCVFHVDPNSPRNIGLRLAVNFDLEGQDFAGLPLEGIP